MLAQHSRSRILSILTPLLVTLGCSASGAGGGRSHANPDTSPTGSDTGQAGTSGMGTVSTSGNGETCDGYDNDGNGQVDEGCTCVPGDVQQCYPGFPGDDDLGICEAGTQRCAEGSAEFGGEWGPCEGAVLPAIETCGDGVDSDCDGSDPPCDSGMGGAGGEGGDPGQGGAAGTAGAAGASGSAGAPTCVPTTEICGNGIDEDCNGIDDPCDEICQDISLFGDCLTVSCPPTHPYPASCNVFFTPGDHRGCVASTPTSSSVYFQAGDACNAGFVTGTLCCGTSPSAPLNQASCPINKPKQFHVTSPDQCPETH